MLVVGVFLLVLWFVVYVCGLWRIVCGFVCCGFVLSLV